LVKADFDEMGKRKPYASESEVNCTWDGTKRAMWSTRGAINPKNYPGKILLKTDDEQKILRALHKEQHLKYKNGLMLDVPIVDLVEKEKDRQLKEGVLLKDVCVDIQKFPWKTIEEVRRQVVCFICIF
jgi:hypothetical protein